jgi:uncharacterized protein (DUF2461 family)
MGVMNMNTQHFPPDALQFLRDLAVHNDRAWFETQRERFALSLRDPFVAFLVDLKPRLADVNAGFVVDARTHGGSLARIHRDMRFAVDGQPYKTALSAHFAHENEATGASFFLYLEPGCTRVGAGIRHPSAAATKALKRAMQADEAGWQAAMQNVLDRGGSRERFTLSVPLADETVTTARFLDDVVAACRVLDPFVRLLCDAVVAGDAARDHAAPPPVAA